MSTQPHWQCLRSGHCCSNVGTVTMTLEERAVIEAEIGPGLEWQEHKDARFVRLVGDPACPLLGRDAHGRALCRIHDIRPYNCRRWGCFRDSVDEPFDNAPVQARLFENRTLLRQARRMQRKAQRWAVKHGWREDAGDTRPD